MNMLDKLKTRPCLLVDHVHYAHGYYTFQRLEGGISNNMTFNGKTIIAIITALFFVSSIAKAQDTESAYKSCTDSFTCDSMFTDSRDFKVYHTVRIGSQCWMAENLNYGTYVSIATGQDSSGTQKYCYNDLPFNCNTYGGLYEWTEMMNGEVACNGPDSLQPACNTPVQGICPCGWHVPSHYEWTLLERNVGSTPEAFTYTTIPDGYHVYIGTNEGSNLKETGTVHWTYPNAGATNNSGFTALGGGTSYEGLFENFRKFGDWWTSTEGGSPTSAWNHHLDFDSTNVFRFYHEKPHGFSVRCVQDTLYSTTSIKKNVDESYLIVFPNPSSSEITIKTNNKSEKINYNIMNLFGQIVQSGYLTDGNVKVSIANLSDGMYFIRTLGKKSQVIKILKY